MTTITSPERAAILQAGACAARDGMPRSRNPYSVESEDWINWMDGFDQQTAWLEHGRGSYEPQTDPHQDDQ